MTINKEYLLDNKAIKEMVFIFEFPLQEQIQRFIYEFETKFKTIFPDEAIDTRVPQNYNPSTPRFILRDDKKKRYLEVSQDKAILKFAITEEHSKNSLLGISFFKEKCIIASELIQKILNTKFYILHGVTNLNYSFNESPPELKHTFFIEKFLNTQNIEIPNSFKFTLGYFDEADLQSTLQFQDYERVKVNINPKEMMGDSANTTKTIRLTKDDPRVIREDHGVSINITVNNLHPSISSKYTMEPTSTINKIFDVTQSRVDSMEDFLLI